MYVESQDTIVENFTTSSLFHILPKYLVRDNNLSGGSDIQFIVEWDKQRVNSSSVWQRFTAGIVLSPSPTVLNYEWSPNKYQTRDTIIANNYRQQIVFYQEEIPENLNYILFVAGAGGGNIIRRAWIQPHEMSKLIGAKRYPRAGYSV